MKFDHIRTNPNLCGGVEASRMELELRTAAFPSRSPDGYNRFSHRSFLDPAFGYNDALTNAAFSADGQRIVTASVDNTARVWDAAGG